MKSISLILLCQLLLGHSEVRAIRKEYKCEVINSLQQIYVKYIEPISRGLIYNSSLEGAVFHFRTAGRGLFQRAAQKSFNANDPRNDQEKVNVLFQEFLQDKDKKQIKKIPGGYPYGCRTWKCSKSTGQYFTVGCVFTAKNFSLAWQFTSTFDTFFKKLNSGTIWDSGLSDQAVTLLSNINMNTTSDQIKTKVQTTLRVVDEESIRTALSVLLRHMYDDEQLKKIKPPETSALRIPLKLRSVRSFYTLK
ncbi:hypothetical protein Q1695_004052 [Nippostrongylus brasiliensis]|nr:hypothetical protein Q1695_004052 [Nippostrongylus brasiliensis]